MAHAYLHLASTAPDQFCGKTGFPSRVEARRAMGRMGNPSYLPVASSVGRTKLYSWRCKACRLWHIAHRPQKR